MAKFCDWLLEVNKLKISEAAHENAQDEPWKLEIETCILSS